MRSKRNHANWRGGRLWKCWGGWGVDVVETRDPDGFLQAINWSGLTAGRPADGIFQVINRPA